jgi:hypothetical protein
MSALLLRIGGLLMVAAAVYLAVWETLLGGADRQVARTILQAGLVCLGGGLLLWIAGRAGSRFLVETCPKCGRRVSRGRTFCDDHRNEAINSYRDRERKRGG